MEFVNADCDKIAVENPVGYMNTHFRKPNQIIHPYYFGDPYVKRTCLCTPFESCFGAICRCHIV